MSMEGVFVSGMVVLDYLLSRAATR
jgi:hypothetical protein